MGKLICIEAGDGSGKETQTGRLFRRLQENNCKVRKVEYPNYASESSSLIKMYLRGDFGSRAEEVNPYVASTFYAVDRYESFKTEWEGFYHDGGIILADRYTTSNMIHQAAKITDPALREDYLNWLWHFEFEMFIFRTGLCCLSGHAPACSSQLIQNRRNKITGSKKDIHESDSSYLRITMQP